MDSSHLSARHSTPLEGAHSHQVRVPDDRARNERVGETQVWRKGGPILLLHASQSITVTTLIECFKRGWK